MNINFETCPRRKQITAVAFAIFAPLLAGYPGAALAQASHQKTFSSAEEATRALVVAVQSNDERAMTTILGAGKELTSLDDELQNKAERDLFIQKYRQMHRLVREPDGTTVLYIGAENWPFPVPLVSTNDSWHFDSKAGAMEVLFRRIGENEATAIYVCHSLAQAERRPEGADSVGQYPQGAQSYIRALLASTSNDRRASQDKDRGSFHGYYFRILTKQGKNASAAKSNASDKMSNQVAFVAYPMEYRSTGVMTFIVNQDDAVYEKDLGPKTAKLARAMTAYKPDSTWSAAE
jgi:hypothetical protein